jgi:hypothetical protein
MCQMVTEMELFQFPDLNPLRFFYMDLDMRKEVNKTGGYTRRIDRSDFGRHCQHKETRSSTRRHLHTLVAKFFEVDGGIFRHLLGTVINFVTWVTIIK